MKEKDILVSAIIITYKRPPDIVKRAVTSVINQTYKNIELFVVNDCPKEEKLVVEIENMLNEFNDSRINYIVHKENGGACKARNTGILAAKGDYIALLDDDDEWLIEKIESQLEGFNESDIGIVYSPFYNVVRELPGELCARSKKSGNMLKDMLRMNCLGGSSMPMMRKEVFDKCGMFDENLLSSQDYDMWVRITQHYRVKYIDKPLVRRYVQEESITTNFEKQKQGFNYFTNKHIDLYRDNPKALNYRLNRRVNKWIEQGEVQEALSLYKQALRAKLISRYNICEPLKGSIKLLSGKKRRNMSDKN